MVKMILPYTGDIVTREEAKAKGLKRFFTGIPCTKGHLAERKLRDGCCFKCLSISNLISQKNNRVKVNKRRTKWRSKQRELGLDQEKEYRSRPESKQKTTIRRKKWGQTNKNKINIRRRELKKINKIEYLRKEREYKNKNREHIRAMNKLWAKNNPDKRSTSWRNRRARVSKAEGCHTTNDVKNIMEKQEFLCNGCSCRIAFQPKNGEVKAHVDHIYPLVKGGTNWPDNLQCLCWFCNVSKGALTPLEWQEKLRNDKLLKKK